MVPNHIMCCEVPRPGRIFHTHKSLNR